MAVDNKHFPLTQFHLHEPSEHELGGIRHYAGLHLVRTADDGSITLSGLIDKSVPNAALGNYFEELPAVCDDAGLDDSQLLPADRTNVRHSESLATALHRGMQWVVMADPIQAWEHQLDSFRSVIEQNSRPFQEQANRCVLPDSEEH